VKIFSKYILLSIGIILISVGASYAKKKTIITVEKDLRKIQITNHKGYIVKTYYEMYNIKYGWVRAICKEEKVKHKNLFKMLLNCNFSPSSLRLINSPINNNEIKKVSSKNLNNNNQQEESQQEESQEEESQEETQEEENQEEENTLPGIPHNEECNDPTIC
jgi:hypothetical protein